jgi:hypothetical protein
MFKRKRKVRSLLFIEQFKSKLEPESIETSVNSTHKRTYIKDMCTYPIPQLYIGI